jgi:hypothetical protein
MGPMPVNGLCYASPDCWISCAAAWSLPSASGLNVAEEIEPSAGSWGFGPGGLGQGGRVQDRRRR